MSWLVPHRDGVVLTIKAVPRASRSELAGLTDDALRVRLQAPPVDGKANKALIEFLAEALQTPKRSLTLLTGDTSRHKRILVTGLTGTDVRRRLGL